jgi:5-methylcytosine-specific restriction endonuclease McrBC regulatory subunit McrC
VGSRWKKIPYHFSLRVSENRAGIEGRIEVTERRGRRRMQLPDNFNEKREYLKLKEEALNRTLRRTRF